jgi:hypothetical protein
MVPPNRRLSVHSDYFLANTGRNPREPLNGVISTDGIEADELEFDADSSPGVCVSSYELAELNIARLKEPLESPGMADFVANLDRINAIAESSPGFVWRLQTEEGDATALRPLGQDTLVNLSVWRDTDSLSHYVYKSAHVEIMRRRKEWFERVQEAFVVLWWIRKGHRPRIAEATLRLELLRTKGPTAEAFTFGQVFPPPDAPAPRSPFAFGSESPTT